MALGRLGRKFHSFSCDGMDKSDFVGEQGDLTWVIQLRILPLPYQRISPAGELDPDLMGASRMKLNLHPGYLTVGIEP